MTIKDLAQGENNERQLAIFQRADRLLADRCGRYFMGQLTQQEVNILAPRERAERRDEE